MTRKYLWLALCSAFLLIAACQKAPELTLTGSSKIELSVDGSSATISFTANRDWRVSSSDSWVSVSPSSGTASDGPVSVTVRCNANTTYDDRTATVTIKMEELSQAITVRQPANLGIVLPSQSFDLQSDARTIEVEVKANVDYTVETSVDWIKQTGTKGLTSKTLTFSIEENKTYDPREGKITIKSKVSSVSDQVISVKQAQKDAIIVEKTSYDMPYGGGEIEIKVEANVGFDVTPDSEWLHHVSTKALSSSTVLIKVDENETYNARKGKVEITQQNGSIKHTIAINQAGRIAVTSVELSNTELTLMVGSTETLVATVKPDDATDKTVTWTSSDNGVATVDERGLVTAISDGTATISVTAGDIKATCIVTVMSIPDNAIDLGIYVTRGDGTSYKVYWADCNIGASKPEEVGDYYAWGEIETKEEYSWSNYKWAGVSNDKYSTVTKYCPVDAPMHWSGNGDPDNKTTLDPEDDVAHVKLGGKWRIPTKEEWKELIKQGTWKWVERNGLEGSEILGNGEKVFIPLTGDRKIGMWATLYWSSSCYGISADVIRISEVGDMISVLRSEKMPIRPIIASEDITIDMIALNKNSLSLWVYDSETLSASVLVDGVSPSFPVVWSSSDSKIASVNPDGTVYAGREGTAIITAKAGGKSAECVVTIQRKPPVYVGNAVDLGVVVTRSDGTTYKLFWADCDLGAATPEERGEYYAWGEHETKYDFTWETYKWANGAENKLTKYCPVDKPDYWGGAGSPDGKTVLDLEDDVAHVKLGGKWRLPTREEWEALEKQCTKSSTIINGVNGDMIRGSEGSIFIREYQRHWTSSLSNKNVGSAWNWSPVYYELYGGASSRMAGLLVRPVMEETVTAVTLNKTKLVLMVGETYKLEAEVQPESVCNKDIIWSSSDETVATVSSSGVVKALALGTANIIATSADSGVTATCKLSVVEYNAVDLGLSVKWANMNIGAAAPEEYGDYYAWGETETKDNYTWETYKFRTSGSTSKDLKFSKYCPTIWDSYWGGSGAADNKTTLDPEDDVAHVKLGGKWRIPTKEEWEELINGCSMERTTQGGVSGLLFSGTNGNSIFFPAPGWMNGSYVEYPDGLDFYWSSNLERATIAYHFNGGYISILFPNRYAGFPVRAVQDN